MIQDAVVDLFIENATKAGAHVVRVTNVEELNSSLAGMLDGVNSVYSPGLTETERTLEIPAECRTDDYKDAAACVEEVHGAIAETGSLICSSRGGRSVQAGLLPRRHIAIVSAENIFADLDRFLGDLGDSPPTNVTLETGPSRTADIELTLTIGVHGPEHLGIIVL